MYTLPNISSIKDDPAKTKSAVEAWKEYFQKQLIIKTLEGDEISDEAFTVLAPLTFLHLNDFKNGLSSATTAFTFMTHDAVETEESTGLGTISYISAFKEIVQRVTGVLLDYAIIPEVPEKDLLTAEEENGLAEKMKMFNENLELWMEKFRKLPAVESVNPYDMDNPDRLVTINVKTSFPRKDCIDFYTLDIGNTIDHPDWDNEGKSSTVYDKWCEGEPAKTWADLYQALVELSNIYVGIPQA